MKWSWVVNLVDSLKGLLNIPAVFIDGGLYALSMMLVALQSQFASEEAVKFLSPDTLFWTRTVVSALAAFTLALKMFRSSSYADHQKNKVSIDTAFIKKQPENG